MLATTKFTNEPLIRRAINANLRVGTRKAMQILMQYAKGDGNPVAMRAEALDALSTWAKPSLLDRVDGRYRGPVTRDLASVKSQSASLFTSLAASAEPVIRRSAIPGHQPAVADHVGTGITGPAEE